MICRCISLNMYVVFISVSCPPGFVSSSGEAPCTECDINTYSSNGRSCTICPSNTLADKTGSALVTECAGESCTKQNLVRPHNLLKGNTLRVWMTKFHNWCNFSTVVLFFLNGVYLCPDYCPAGYFSINGAMPCRPCPRNYYQPSLGASSCIECGSHQITLDTAQSSSLGCVSGGMCWTLLFYHLMA